MNSVWAVIIAPDESYQPLLFSTKEKAIACFHNELKMAKRNGFEVERKEENWSAIFGKDNQWFAVTIENILVN